MSLAHHRDILIASIVLVGVGLLLASAPVSTQPYPVPPTWGGDFWTRPRLTGDWGGLRDERRKKGVVFDVDVAVTPMDVLSGGRHTGGNTWGNADYTFNVDTDKLGLSPGGFLKVSADFGFGTTCSAIRAQSCQSTPPLYFPGTTTIPPHSRTQLLLNVDAATVAGIRIRARF